MNDRRIFRLVHATARGMAKTMIDAPECEGWVVTIAPPTRTLEQNAKLHAMLDDVAKQVVWHGEKLDTDAWKAIFVAALHKMRLVPGIEPGQFVPIGRTRSFTIAEMSDMIELIYAFGADHSVVWSEPDNVLQMRR